LVDLLDNLQINCGEEFGGILPLNQVGQVSVKDPQTLLISVFDPKVNGSFV
jgi:ribosome recycling factor